MTTPTPPPAQKGIPQKSTCLPQPSATVASAFFRYWVNDRSFIRGAARLLAAPIEQPFPTQISDVIVLDPGGITGADDVQTIKTTGTPTAGFFTLRLDADTTAGIAFDATAIDVQTELEGLASVGAGNVTVSGGPLP